MEKAAMMIPYPVRTGKQTPSSGADFPSPIAMQGPPSLDIPHPLCYIPAHRLSFLRSKTVPFIATGKYLPNRMIFFFRQALQESIGLAAAERIWRAAGPQRECLPPASDDLEKSVDFSCFSGLCFSVAGVYGGDGARSILYRCGRTAFTKTLRSTSAIVGLDGPHFHESPGSGRIAEGLRSIIRLLSILSDMECSVDIAPGEYRFHSATCPECIGRIRGSGICFGMAGIFRGALDWFGIDPEIPVMETECGISGCAFSVSTAC